MALIKKNDLPESGSNRFVPPDLKVHESIADTLRAARQEHGQELRTVAQVLRIRYAYLEAIENGDFEQLPGAAYALGFLRTYAEFLGLDGQEIVEQYKREIQGVESKPDLVFPQPVGHNHIPGGAIVLISVVVLGLAYGGWFYLSNEGKNIADLMPAVPESVLALFSGDGDGQAGVTPQLKTTPEMAPETVLATDSTLEAAPLGDAPPENAEVESPAPVEAANPENVADIEPPAPPAPAELAVVDAPVPPTDIEVAQDDTMVAEAVPLSPEPPAPISAPAVEAAEELDDPVSEIVAADEVLIPEIPEAPVPEIVAANGAPDSEAPDSEAPEPEAVAEIAEPVALLAPPPTPAPTAFVEPEPSVSVDNSLLTLAVVAGPANRATTASAGSVEPMLDETVVIPAPPTATRDLVLSTERLPRVYGESNRGARIVLRAVQDSWVQVRDRQDALLLTRVLRDGDTYFVPPQDGLTLLTGNAGGIVIEVDGVAVAPLGPVGAVRRQIALDPVRLLDGTALPR